jgi:hypothetical protein
MTKIVEVENFLLTKNLFQVGWDGGCMDVKVVIRIAYSNQQSFRMNKTVYMC